MSAATVKGRQPQTYGGAPWEAGARSSNRISRSKSTESWFLVGNASVFLALLFVLSQAATRLRGSCDIEYVFNPRTCVPLPKVAQTVVDWAGAISLPMLAGCAGHSWRSELAAGPKRMVARRICLGVAVYFLLNAAALLRGDDRAGTSWGISKSLLRSNPVIAPFRPADLGLWYMVSILACRLWLIPLQHLRPAFLAISAHALSIVMTDIIQQQQSNAAGLGSFYVLFPFFSLLGSVSPAISFATCMAQCSVPWASS
eukprot:SAG31_NODE_9579_length_1256_cov_1.480553_2_plen_257_part_00